MMKTVVVLAVTLVCGSLPTNSSAQTVVYGQADPSVDVLAVQAAVDMGGTVILRGTFDFLEVSLPGGAGAPRRVITVTRAVRIHGEEATILGGGSAAQAGQQGVFLVDTTGNVAITGIHFLSPHNTAIRVVRSGDVELAGNTVDGVIPSPVGTPAGVQNAALAFHLNGGPFGAVSILENDIHIGGTEDDSSGGIFVILTVGAADSVAILANQVTGTTSHGMDVRNIGGPALIAENFVATGVLGRSGLPGQFVGALRIIGSGEYDVVGNYFDCGFENAAVVRLGGTSHAVVSQNVIVASVAAGQTPGLQSAGVQVQGSASGNEILENRIYGRARVAISVIHSDFALDRPPNSTGDPVDTTMTGNNHQHFDDTFATIEVGAGAVDTTIYGGSGTLVDEGSGTIAHGAYRAPDSEF
jgi:hypothetical protein